MWTCRHCGLDIVSGADAERDATGCYFRCPGCTFRNELVNTGDEGEGDPIDVAQPDP